MWNFTSDNQANWKYDSFYSHLLVLAIKFLLVFQTCTFLPLQVIKRRNVRQEDRDHKTERRRLKTTRLKEYTIKSHSSMPPNNTYANFERFSQVLEEIAAAEEGLKELERNQRSCREDVAALLSIYEEKEGWYKEENQSISGDLNHIRQELQRTQTQRKKCQEDARVTMQSANILKRKFGRLENRYEVLAEQVASEVRWVEELVKSISAEKDGLSSGSTPWAALTSSSEGFIIKLSSCLSSLLVHYTAEFERVSRHHKLRRRCRPSEREKINK